MNRLEYRLPPNTYVIGQGNAGTVTCVFEDKCVYQQRAEGGISLT